MPAVYLSGAGTPGSRSARGRVSSAAHDRPAAAPAAVTQSSRTPGPRTAKARSVAASRVVVRRTRRGRALRINGTFASWYQPGTPITGSVWDALAAPLLLLPPRSRRRVLILGLGGGSAARIVRAIAPRAKIVGVELDRAVVRAARQWFDLDGLGVEVVQGDARRYLERSRRRFDIIFEDVFVGSEHDVHKPDWQPDPGHALARKRLHKGGILVSNTIDEAAVVARVMRGSFRSALRIRVEDFDNTIVVGAQFPLSGRALRSAVLASPILSPTAPNLRFERLPSRS